MVLTLAGLDYVWIMQADGNVVVYHDLNNPCLTNLEDIVSWASDTWGTFTAPNFSVRLDDDCNLSLYEYNCDPGGSVVGAPLKTIVDPNTQTGDNWRFDDP